MWLIDYIHSVTAASVFRAVTGLIIQPSQVFFIDETSMKFQIVESRTKDID